MRLSIFNIIAFCFVINLYAQETKYERRIKKYQTNWENVIPTHMKIQFAGSMGFLSIGTGWDYGKRDQWETDIMIGFIPKYSTSRTKITFTLKQNYLPWKVPLGNKGFSFEPLACGLYVNTVSGDQFWKTDPDRYPKGYYNISTKIRFHVFLGERITFKIPPEKRFGTKAVTFFYEISTCDLYIVSAVQNSYLKPTDYLALSFGLKLQLF